MSNMDHPWAETETGWTAFASDLQLGLPAGMGARTPQGERIDLSFWDHRRDVENDITEWRKRLPDGKQLVIYND